MMDATARSGRRREGCVDDKVLGAYGQDSQNDNGTATAGILSRKPTCSRQYVFQCTQAWNLLHFLKSNYWKRSVPPGLYPHVANKRFVQHVTVRRPPVAKPESDDYLVAAGIRLLGHFAPNRRKRNEGQADDRLPTPDGESSTLKSLHRKIHSPTPWHGC